MKDRHERKLPDNIQADEWRFPLPYPQVVQASDYYVKYLDPFLRAAVFSGPLASACTCFLSISRNA